MSVLKKVPRVDEYVKYGTCFCKNEICLTNTNLMERVATFYKYKVHKNIGSILLGVLLEMLRSR
jgi:hypothetical protein